MTPNETEVIRKAKNGSNEAFDTIVRHNRSYIYNLLLQLTNDPAAADDLTQETFLQVFRKLSTFRFESKLRTWIGRIAINCYRQTRRKKKHDRDVVLDVYTIPCDGDSPERIVIKREIKWCVAHVLQHHMPPTFREILVLRDLQDYTYTEISEILGISMSSVKVRLHRARMAMRDHFVNVGCKAMVEEYVCTCDGVDAT